MSSTASPRHDRPGDGVALTALWDADPQDNLTITTVGRQDGSACLHLTGALEFATAELLDVAVDSIIAAGPSELCLDLGRVEFCDCAGIGALVRARRSAQEAGGVLTTRSVSPQLYRIMWLLRLDDLLPRSGVDATPRKRAPGDP